MSLYIHKWPIKEVFTLKFKTSNFSLIYNSVSHDDPNLLCSSIINNECKNNIFLEELFFFSYRDMTSQTDLEIKKTNKKGQVIYYTKTHSIAAKF